MAFRSQSASGRSLSVSSSRSLAPVCFSGFGSQSVMAGGLQSGASLGFGSGAGLGFGSGAGLGFGSGAGLGFGSGFGSGHGIGGGSLSTSLRTVGGTLSSTAGGGSFGASFRAGGGCFAEAMSNIINEKQQMQVLNDRLATYLEKVKRLETTNFELNEKLRSFTINRVQSSFNLEPYEIQIKPLREKLLLLMQDHTRITLAVDNAKLAADDFRMKFETELAMRQSVESDIAGLKTLKREYSSTNAILLQEVTGLEKERAALKDAHHQDMKALRGEMMGTVTVDVKESESTDLSRVLADIRAEYEMVIEKNRRQAESWYTKQVEKKQAEVELFTETTVSGGSEITESHKQSMTLQTQLDAALMEKANLEQRLVAVQAQYQSQFFSLAQLAGSLEGELTSVRESTLQQSRDYQLLLSTKVQLEREISTYKALLEGAGEFSNLSALKKPAKKMETLKVETEKVETKKVETEKVETKKVETEKVEVLKVETEKVEVLKVETERIALTSSDDRGAGGGAEVPASEAQSGGSGAIEVPVGGGTAYALMALEGVSSDPVMPSSTLPAEA
ncbi:keratin, type I cytoskeletal 47 kDa isoform X1 [Carassius gibelio]|uniref:keratin, type I cytoskeletal 47 kDa isoform X1 n=1 Tax=Carassius gibelio TaxID=101364 RepID=UPI002277F50E|nr:keratin, type I cytoskeletal 47 kDa isoform X1 [Carassius gibelio]